MKKIAHSVLAGLFGLVAVFGFFTFTSVPEVYVDSSEITYTNGVADEISIASVRKVQSPKGVSLPISQWQEVLKGRYHLVIVDPSWQTSEKGL